MEKTGLTIRLLGAPDVRWDGEPVTGFISDKARALLYYLVATEELHTRQTLAALFWGDMPEAQALKNLRQALYNLQKLLPESLDVSRQSARLHPAAAAQVDVVLFRRLLADPASAAQEQAVALYKGALLAGFSVADAPAFEMWLAQQREHLHQQALTGLDRLIEEALAVPDNERAISLLHQLTSLEPWAEKQQTRLISLLARRGEYNTALRQYELLHSALAAELDVPPMPETAALVQRVRRARLLARAHTPQPHTPLVGRTVELAHLRRLLNSNQPHPPRLITISGPGGIGKTHLAQTVALEHRHAFLDGVWWVSLAALPSLDDAVTAIADAVGVDLQGPSQAQTQLIQALRGREMLLVLDNSEHLLSADFIDFLLALLGQAPDVRLLLTSRERLQLQQEQVLLLNGLPVENDAPTLFINRARQIVFDYAPGPTDLATIRTIARLVEGMPLALELAASLIDQYSPATIALHVTANLDALATSYRDAPPRRRSIRAVFDYSWELLTAVEQERFARLALFEGGFTGAAAQEVAEAAPELLRGLTHKSLIRFVPDAERYSMHDLMRQYAREKLDANPEAAARTGRAHSRYYARFLDNHKLRLERGDRRAVEIVAAERDNIRAMWQRACGLKDVETINLVYHPLAFFYDATARYVEGKALFGLALAHLDPRPQASPSAQPSYLAGLLLAHANLRDRLGEYAPAIEELERSLEISKVYNETEGLNYALLLLGRVELDRGRFERAEAWLQQAAQLCRARRDVSAEGRALLRLGEAQLCQGKGQAARSSLEQALACMRGAHKRRGTLYAQVALGVWEAEQGNLAAAQEWWQRTLSLPSSPGAAFLQAEAQVQIGYYLILFERFDEAERLLIAALPPLLDQTHGVTFATAINHLALLYALWGRTAQAQLLFQRAAALVANLGTVRQSIGLLLTYGHLCLARGDSSRAAQALGVVSCHEASTHGQVSLARRLLAAHQLKADAGLSPQAIVAGLLDEEEARRAEELIQKLVAGASAVQT